MAKLPFAVEHTGPNVLTIRMEFESSTGWEQWFLLQGDEHWDNPHCNRTLLKKHHEEAVRRNAGILKVGDTFCAMQGKYDKRSDKGCLRPEHQCGDYLDSLVRTAADWYAPYAKNILLFGDGNHETSIRNRHETDLLERLAATLSDRTGSLIQHGGYTGWVRFLVKRCEEKCSRKLWYMHGYGGGGPVTQDMIQAQRQRAYVENADIMATSHTHDAWLQEAMRIRLNNNGVVEQRPVLSVKVGTYKDEYAAGKGGWHVETGKPPKPLGAWWLRLYWEEKQLKTELQRAS